MAIRGLPPSRSSSQATGGAMTDISFLLIVFFLVALVVVAEDGVPVRLPEEDQKPEVIEESRIITIEMLEDGQHKVGETVFPNLVDLSSGVSQQVQATPDAVAIIETRAMHTYQDVLDVLEATRTGGIVRFSINVIDEEGEPIPIKLQ